MGEGLKASLFETICRVSALEFVHVTVSPACTVSVCGSNPSVVMVTPDTPAGAPAEASARASAGTAAATSINLRIRDLCSSLSRFRDVAKVGMTRAVRALVTGGTGRVGTAIVRRLEADGASVVAAGRRDGDLSRPAEAHALVDHAAGALG